MNEKETKKYIRWGKFSMHPKYNVPVLEVVYGDEVVGYMTPFRGYHFQISRTYDGEHSMGTSYSGGATLYNRYRGLDRPFVHDVYMALIASCVLAYISTPYGAGKEPGGSLMYTHNDELEKFVEASIDFVDGIR